MRVSPHLFIGCLNLICAIPTTTTYKPSDIFELSKSLVVACYALTAKLPPDEKTALTHYIRTASLTAHLNIAQCAFLKKRRPKKRLVREAKNSLLVIDAAMDVMVEVKLIQETESTEVMRLSSICYGLLARLRKRK